MSQDTSRSRPKKPIVALFERFILDTIGHRHAPEAPETTTLVIRVFRKQNDWQTWFRDELGLNSEFEANLKAVWRDAQVLAKAKRTDLSPEDFAETIVEENFLDALDMLDAGLEAERALPD